MCGIFGIYNHQDASELTYLGLYSLQHRGQESAGIVSSNGERFLSKLGEGEVQEVFSKEDLTKLNGKIAIGHVRYSTYGASEIKNAQPIVVKCSKGLLAIAHNGNLVNAKVLRNKLEKEG
ncbi:MAG: amidophosphoribosyltransferase, partial [Endomicrobiia bacterium]